MVDRIFINILLFVNTFGIVKLTFIWWIYLFIGIFYFWKMFFIMFRLVKTFVWKRLRSLNKITINIICHIYNFFSIYIVFLFFKNLFVMSGVSNQRLSNSFNWSIFIHGEFRLIFCFKIWLAHCFHSYILRSIMWVFSPFFVFFCKFYIVFLVFRILLKLKLIRWLWGNFKRVFSLWFINTFIVFDKFATTLSTCTLGTLT